MNVNLDFGLLNNDTAAAITYYVRSRIPVPGPHDFKISLRLILLAHYKTTTKKNYFNDFSDSVMKYCKNIGKNQDNEKKEQEIELLPSQFLFVDEDQEAITEEAEQCLYYILGNVLHKVKKKCM